MAWHSRGFARSRGAWRGFFSSTSPLNSTNTLVQAVGVGAVSGIAGYSFGSGFFSHRGALEDPGPAQVPDPRWQWASDTCAMWSREWNRDWDGRAAPPGTRWATEGGAPPGRVRHLLLVRHGQYDLDSNEHGLTEMGRAQARKLGERLASMLGKVQKDRHHEIPIHFSGIWVSDATRAMQTAEIVAKALPSVPVHDPDSLLTEGTPCMAHPHKTKTDIRSSSLWHESVRIELAFRTYVHRDVDLKKLASAQARRSALGHQGDQLEPEPEPVQMSPASDFYPSPSSAGRVSLAKPLGTATRRRELEHTYEIIVCHCNVIRYFVMRALQLPPEAWLRCGGYNTGITEIEIRPDGGVSLCRMGDVGHLPIDMVSFH